MNCLLVMREHCKQKLGKRGPLLHVIHHYGILFRDTKSLFFDKRRFKSPEFKTSNIFERFHFEYNTDGKNLESFILGKKLICLRSKSKIKNCLTSDSKKSTPHSKEGGSFAQTCIKRFANV